MLYSGDPTGIRTRVTGVRGQRPKPLDDGTFVLSHEYIKRSLNVNHYLVSFPFYTRKENTE